MKDKEQSPQARLITAMADQLDGKRLPDLRELEGTELRVKVKNGRLNWSHAKHVIVDIMC